MSRLFLWLPHLKPFVVFISYSLTFIIVAISGISNTAVLSVFHLLTGCVFCFFLYHSAMRAQYMLWCMSVCLSIICQYYFKMALWDQIAHKLTRYKSLRQRQDNAKALNWVNAWKTMPKACIKTPSLSVCLRWNMLFAVILKFANCQVPQRYLQLHLWKPGDNVQFCCRWALCQHHYYCCRTTSTDDKLRYQ